MAGPFGGLPLGGRMFTRLDKAVTYCSKNGRVYDFPVGACINLAHYPELEKQLKKSPVDKMVRSDEVKTK